MSERTGLTWNGTRMSERSTKGIVQFPCGLWPFRLGAHRSKHIRGIGETLKR
jgi:hypothetical protein